MLEKTNLPASFVHFGPCLVDGSVGSSRKLKIKGAYVDI
jgi:hypothetical protein